MICYIVIKLRRALHAHVNQWINQISEAPRSTGKPARARNAPGNDERDRTRRSPRAGLWVRWRECMPGKQRGRGGIFGWLDNVGDWHADWWSATQRNSDMMLPRYVDDAAAIETSMLVCVSLSCNNTASSMTT